LALILVLVLRRRPSWWWEYDQKRAKRRARTPGANLESMVGLGDRLLSLTTVLVVSVCPLGQTRMALGL
jgi:hypothetical protein